MPSEILKKAVKDALTRAKMLGKDSVWTQARSAGEKIAAPVSTAAGAAKQLAGMEEGHWKATRHQLEQIIREEMQLLYRNKQ